MPTYRRAARARAAGLLLAAAAASPAACSDASKGGAAPAVDPAPAAAASDPAALGGPVALPVSGTWVHGPTGIAFPQDAAGFARGAAWRYDVEGRDVAMSYARAWPDFRAVVTLHVLPAARVAAAGARPDAPESLDEKFAGEVGKVRFSLGEVLGTRTATTSGAIGGAPAEGRSAEMRIAHGLLAGSTELCCVATLVTTDAWSLRYRVTVPAPHAADALPAVEALLASLRLPPTGLAAAR